MRVNLYSLAMGTVKKVYKSDFLCAIGIARGVLILSHFWSLRAGLEVAFSAFRFHQGVALARALLQIEEKISYPVAVLGSLL
jgi:hypothetical protein